MGRTKIVTLNSSDGTLNGSDDSQLNMLEDALGEVAERDELTGITVFFHHPPQDPLPSKTSQLGDRREAEELEKKLGEFRKDSGKSAAVINGHVGAFHGSAVEGVSYLINGNSGKGPAGTPATGGFTGWTMLGVDPGVGDVGDDPTTADRVGWLAAETKPRVDSISLEAPGSLAPGQSADVAASFTQGERTVPVGWPATAQWGGDGVVVDSGAEVAMQQATGAKVSAQSVKSGAPEAASDVVRVNPATGQITAENPGTATLEVTVNGKTAKATVEVAGEEPPPSPGDDDGSADSGGSADSAGAEDGSDASSTGGEDGSSEGSDDDGASTKASAGADEDSSAGSGSDGASSNASSSASGGSEASGSSDSESDGTSSTASSRSDANADGSSDGNGDLPRTGGPVLLTALLGALLVIGGIIAVRAARARRAGRPAGRH